jgi:hypothetical protein
MGKPSFESTLDNLTILKKTGKAWEVHATIYLRSFDDASFALPIFTEHTESSLVS